jgi:hypothetical protein
MVGYAVIVFFTTLLRQIGTPLLVVVSNSTHGNLRVLSFIMWFGVPVVIAVVVLTIAGRADHSRRS